MHRGLMIVPALLLAVGLAGCARSGGGQAGGSPSGRVIDVEMIDLSFSPDHLTVGRGEMVTFRFHNAGGQVHEALVGDDAAQMADEEAMGHGSGGMTMHAGVEVRPGATGELSYTFDRAGELLIGCHEPGHYAAGMKATVSVMG